MHDQCIYRLMDCTSTIKCEVSLIYAEELSISQGQSNNFIKSGNF